MASSWSPTTSRPIPVLGRIARHYIVGNGKLKGLVLALEDADLTGIQKLEEYLFWLAYQVTGISMPVPGRTFINNWLQIVRSRGFRADEILTGYLEMTLFRRSLVDCLVLCELEVFLLSQADFNSYLKLKRDYALSACRGLDSSDSLRPLPIPLVQGGKGGIRESLTYNVASHGSRNLMALPRSSDRADPSLQKPRKNTSTSSMASTAPRGNTTTGCGLNTGGSSADGNPNHIKINGNDFYRPRGRARKRANTPPEQRQRSCSIKRKRRASPLSEDRSGRLSPYDHNAWRQGVSGSDAPAQSYELWCKRVKLETRPCADTTIRHKTGDALQGEPAAYSKRNSYGNTSEAYAENVSRMDALSAKGDTAVLEERAAESVRQLNEDGGPKVLAGEIHSLASANNQAQAADAAKAVSGGMESGSHTPETTYPMPRTEATIEDMIARERQEAEQLTRRVRVTAADMWENQ